MAALTKYLDVQQMIMEDEATHYERISKLSYSRAAVEHRQVMDNVYSAHDQAIKLTQSLHQMATLSFTFKSQLGLIPILCFQIRLSLTMMMLCYRCRGEGVWRLLPEGPLWHQWRHQIFGHRKQSSDQSEFRCGSTHYSLKCQWRLQRWPPPLRLVSISNSSLQPPSSMSCSNRTALGCLFTEQWTN